MDAVVGQPEPGEPADIHVQDSQGFVIGDHARVTNNFSGPGRVAGSAYLEQVREIAPADLLGREAELSDLTAFCAGDSPYTWWQAGPWAGKSALLSWFVLNPPLGMDVAAFFVTARLAAQADSTAFSEALVEQLASFLGEQLPASAALGNRDAHRRLLLRTAAQRAHEAGRRLVLVIDGLDEDRSRQMAGGLPSIASLLPRRPEHSLRVIVSGRPHPELPGDVPGDHPLRHCSVQHLAVSPHASDIERLAKDELRRVLRGSQAERDLLGLVTVSLGGLTRVDLTSLTALPPHEIEDTLTGVTGRTISSRVADDPSGAGEHRVHFLAHDTLQVEAERSLGSALLGQYRQRLHDWATHYRESNWPQDTPVYLLSGYLRMLQAARDRSRVAELALDEDRQGRMLDSFTNDIQAALRSLPEEYRVAVYLHEIENFSLQEIADIMGVNLEYARQRVRQGREQVRLALAQQDPGASAGRAALSE